MKNANCVAQAINFSSTRLRGRGRSTHGLLTAIRDNCTFVVANDATANFLAKNVFDIIMNNRREQKEKRIFILSNVYRPIDDIHTLEDVKKHVIPIHRLESFLQSRHIDNSQIIFDHYILDGLASSYLNLRDFLNTTIEDRDEQRKKTKELINVVHQLRDDLEGERVSRALTSSFAIDTIDTLTQRANNLLEDNTSLAAEIETLKAENAALRKENEELKQERAPLFTTETFKGSCAITQKASMVFVALHEDTTKDESEYIIRVLKDRMGGVKK